MLSRRAFQLFRIAKVQRPLAARLFSSVNVDLPVTPGAPPGTMPTVANQGIGPEYEEYVAEQMGQERFHYRGALIGPFGTFENPAPIISSQSHRVVGCVGGGDKRHDLVWFDVKAGPKHMCDRCGQFFILINEDVELAEKAEAEYQKYAEKDE